MNSQRQRFSQSSAGPFSDRAYLSPLLRRVTQDALVRDRVAARLNRTNTRALQDTDMLTPATPSLVERWWNPHVVDQLQTSLTRFRD